tara:strand:+ start:380 stop:931 length:552 start_codon:yes stop_codon:yes gene_type:complete
MRGGIKYDLWLPPEVESRDRHIASFLHAMANDKTRLCWPSLPTLVRVDGRSESNVRQTIKRLVDLEIIEVFSKGTGPKSTRYRIVRGPGFDFRGCLLADTQGAYWQTPKIKEGSSRRSASDAPATSAPTGQDRMGTYRHDARAMAGYNRLGAELGHPSLDLHAAVARAKAANPDPDDGSGIPF